MKDRVRALVRSSAGVDVDYRATRLRLLHGLDVDDLVVLSPRGVELRPPPGGASVAPELVHAKRVEISWTTALFTGSARRVESVMLSDVAVAVVIDAEGKTSFDALSSPSAEPSGPTPPPTPLSGRARELLGKARELPTIDVRDLSVTIWRELPPDGGGPARERTSVEGLALHVEVEGDGGGAHLRVGVGASTPRAPGEIALHRSVLVPRAEAPPREAFAKVQLSADATPGDLAVVLDVEVTRQTFLEGLPPSRLLHVEATARFDEAARAIDMAVDRLDVAGGVATASAAIGVPDGGAPIVRHAEGGVDLARLLALAPPELLPVGATLGRGVARFTVDALALDALPRLGERARVALEADLEDVGVHAEPGVAVELAGAKVDLHVEPGEGGTLHARGSASLDGRIAAGQGEARTRGVTVRLDATQAKEGSMTGGGAVAFDALEVRGGGLQVVTRGGSVTVDAKDVVVGAASPEASRGEVAVGATLGALDVRSSAIHAVLDGLVARARARHASDAPWALDADVRAALLHVRDAAGRTLARAPAHVAVDAVDVRPDVAAPLRSTAGAARMDASLADVTLRLDAAKERDALAFTLDAEAPTLAALRPLVAAGLVLPDAASAPLERMGVTARSRGRIDGLAAAPSVRQRAEVRVERPSLGDVSARSLALVVDTSGTLLRHEIEGDLRVEGLALAGTSPSDDRLAFGADLDAEAPSLRVRLEAAGRAQAKLSAALGFDRARRAVTYDVEAAASSLGPLAPLAARVRGLDALDLSHLDAALVAHGSLLGVVAGVDRGGLRLEDAPRRTAGLDGTLALRAHGVRWAAGAVAIHAPSATLDATFRDEAEGRRVVEGRLGLDELHLASGPHTFDVAGLRDRVSATVLGDLADPEVSARQELDVQAVKQDLLPTYPVGRATAALSARRGRDGVVHVSSLEIANDAGGTSLSLRGAVDTSARGRLSLRGDLKQDLARMSNAPERLAARGTADVGLRVESPDLSVFSTVADVRVADADVRLPAYGVHVEGADGEVPITVAVRVTPRGIEMLREDQDNPYSSLRFTDQHPLLSRSSFVSVRRLELPQVSIAPLVGNLQIQQNIVSLRQFEMGIRGGRVTGQCALDYNRQSSVLDMRVRADSVRSSRGEPFTGSAALVVSAAEHSVEGRADVLQIGRRHLLDLLDLQDPFHADPEVERIRSALRWGYPERLRVTFNHGFASMHVSFGGLARLFSVGDLRGIPIGPVIDRFVVPLVSGGEP